MPTTERENRDYECWISCEMFTDEKPLIRHLLKRLIKEGYQEAKQSGVVGKMEYFIRQTGCDTWQATWMEEAQEDHKPERRRDLWVKAKGVPGNRKPRWHKKGGRNDKP